MGRVSRLYRLWSTVGVLLHVVFVALPKDLWRWTHLKAKSVRGRTVVVTGAASGIGRAVAELLALQHGANVAIIDIDIHGASETVSLIEKKGGVARAWMCDVSRADELDLCAAQICDTFGRVDIVICNAAVLFFGRTLEVSNSQLSKALNVNVLGTLNTVRAFLKPMEERNEGHIVGISSIAGYYGESFGIAYCPSKFAVRGIMECIQNEMRDRHLHGIRVTTVCPYFTRTPMILNIGIRPTSIWFPFMSVERCAREVVDAILKEKAIAFVPNYITIVAALKWIMSQNVQIAGRRYLNCRYEPNLNGDDVDQAISSVEYFEEPKVIIKFATFATITLTAVTYITTEYLSRASFLYFACILTASHLGAAVYALYVSDSLGLSFACASKWFSQTLIWGFPSLFLLLRHKCNS